MESGYFFEVYGGPPFRDSEWLKDEMGGQQFIELMGRQNFGADLGAQVRKKDYSTTFAGSVGRDDDDKARAQVLGPALQMQGRGKREKTRKGRQAGKQRVPEGEVSQDRRIAGVGLFKGSGS